MKPWHIVMLSALASASALTGNAYSQVTRDNLAPAIEKAVASHDTNGLYRAIDAVEKLWTQAPGEYLRVTSQTVQTLLTDPDNDTAQKTLTALFTNVFEKVSPIGNKRQSIVYFDLKREISLFYFGMEATRGDKARLLALASFIGEIRSHIIPDYANKGTSRPGLDILDAAGISDARLLSNPAHIQAYAEAVKANEEALLMNDLQLSLFRANRILTFHLMHSCVRFSNNVPENAQFRDCIIKNARLSGDEAQKFNRTGSP
jgi:hypothetical protein